LANLSLNDSDVSEKTDKLERSRGKDPAATNLAPATTEFLNIMSEKYELKAKYEIAMERCAVLENKVDTLTKENTDLKCKNFVLEFELKSVKQMLSDKLESAKISLSDKFEPANASNSITVPKFTNFQNSNKKPDAGKFDLKVIVPNNVSIKDFPKIPKITKAESGIYTSKPKQNDFSVDFDNKKILQSTSLSNGKLPRWAGKPSFSENKNLIPQNYRKMPDDWRP